jgi:hypothetical protein
MRSVALALLLALSASLRGAAQAPEGTYTVECVFSNPAYSGRCTVSEETPKASPPRKACEAILACLNDSRCVTKTYCNATTVRGGWKLEEAGEKK